MAVHPSFHFGVALRAASRNCKVEKGQRRRRDGCGREGDLRGDGTVAWATYLAVAGKKGVCKAALHLLGARLGDCW